MKSAFLTVLLALLLAPSAQSQDFNKYQRTRIAPPRAGVPAYASVGQFRASHQHNALLSSTPRITGRAIERPLSVSAIGNLDNKGSSTGVLRRSNGAEVFLARDGSIAWMRGTLGQIDPVAGKTPAAAANSISRALEDGHSGSMGSRIPMAQMEVQTLSTDELGQTHVRYIQVIDNVPVAGGELLVHVSSQGEIYALNGRYEPDARVADGTPQMSAGEAIARTVSELEADGKWNPVSESGMRQLHIDPPAAEGVYFPTDSGLRFAFEVSLHANMAESWRFTIDAEDGSVLKKLPLFCTLIHDPDLGSRVDVPNLPEEHFSISPPETSGSASYQDASATDLNGVTQTIRVLLNDDGLYYSIWDLPNATDFVLPNTPAVGGAITLSAGFQDSGDGSLVTSSNNTWSDAVAVSAHQNMKVAYDYFANTFGRKAINNKDESLISVIHITEDGQSMENAFWTGRIMGYGDGGSTFKPLAGEVDVAGHEMTHGVVEHTANLVYEFQPGALNESMADVFGVLIDGDNYLIGEDIMQPGMGLALRDLQNPDNPQVLSVQPAHMNDFQNLGINDDQGGVHVNSGIPNRAAFLVMDAIGRDKTAQIYYRALSTYMTANSQFGDARIALEQASVDLHGAGSTENAAVIAAFDAVGIGGGTRGQGDPNENNVEPIVGDEFIAFVDGDNQVGILNVASDQVTMLDGVFTNEASQLSTPLDGSAIYFINADGRLSRVDLTTLEVGVWDDIFAAEPGDLWNVAIAPDDSVVMLASLYEEDPNLYISDGIDIATIPLKAVTTQDGILDESIVYPDVISWSPFADEPVVAFDALRRLTAGTDIIEFWSVYQMDVVSERVFNLWASQPEGTNVGNLTFSNTDPEVMAANRWETITDETFIDVVDFAGSGGATLEFAEYPDPLRPTFSPDDEFIAFSSPSTSTLIVTDGAGTEGWQFAGPVYNPRWFARAGATASEDEGVLPTRVALDQAYPNPFNPTTTIRFELPLAGQVTVEVVDVLGRSVAVLKHGHVQAGAHEVSWRADSMPSGLYFVRLQAGAEQLVRSVVLAK
ncbi:MAG: Zn-dependent metalloprotease [Rhodothermales bacterium]|jgi:Zn-dependent metalloprotease